MKDEISQPYPGATASASQVFALAAECHAAAAVLILQGRPRQPISCAGAETDVLIAKACRETLRQSPQVKEKYMMKGFSRLLVVMLIGAGMSLGAMPVAAQSTNLPIDVQLDLAVVELERAMTDNDHATVLRAVERIRDLDPTADARSELLFFEAEAALALRDFDRAEAALTNLLTLRGRASDRYDEALSLMVAMPAARAGQGADGERLQGEVVVQDWSASIYDQETEPENRYCSASPRFDPRASLMVSRGSGWTTHYVLLSDYYKELVGYRLRIDGPGGRQGIAVYEIGPTSFMEEGLGTIGLDTPHDAAAFYEVLDLGEGAAILTPGGTALGSFSLRGAAETIRMVQACDL